MARVQGQGLRHARISFERLRRPGAGRRDPDSRVLLQDYDVTFPLFAKVKTVGEGQSPVYRYLVADHGEPKWNFHKYLVSKKGRVIKAFPTSVAPDDPSCARRSKPRWQPDAPAT